MKIALKILPRTKPLRIIFCFSGGVVLSVVLSMLIHRLYWDNTINFVKTTKQNILTQTLPTKLSLLLSDERPEEIQTVLNSTNGYIGLVMTDCPLANINCPQQQITYQTKNDRGWRKEFNPQNLAQYSFDLLTNSAPIIEEQKTNGIEPEDNSKQEDNINQTDDIENSKSGQIIGRVYYIPLTASDFILEFKQWLWGIYKLKLNSIIHPFSALFGVSFLFCVIVWKFIEEEALRIANFYQIRQKQLEVDLKELTESNGKLANDKQKLNLEFENYDQQIEELKRKTNSLKEEVKSKEEKISKQEKNIFISQNLLTNYQQELEKFKHIKSINEEQKQALILKIQEQETNLIEQELEFKRYIDELRFTNEELIVSQEEEQEKFMLLRKIEDEKNQLEKKLAEKEKQLNLKEQQIDKLEQHKEKYQSWQEIAQELEADLQITDELQDKISVLETEKQQLLLQIDNLQQTNQQLQIAFVELQKQNYHSDDEQIATERGKKQWQIICSPSFCKYWQSLADECQIKIAIYLNYLEEQGVTLSDPYSSKVKGSGYRELKPISHAKEAIRIFYRFTPARIPILLCGGNKDGWNTEKWYKKYVAIADHEYNSYMQTQEADSFNLLWQEMNPSARSEAMKGFMVAN